MTIPQARLSDHTFSPVLRTLLIIGLVLVLLGIYRGYKAIWPTPYVAALSGFQIVFPSPPTINKLPSQNQSGVEESAVIYNSENQASGSDYAVYVTTYAGQNFSTLGNASTLSLLNNEIEGFAQNEQANLSDGRSLNFENLTAVEATLTPTKQSEAATQVLAFLEKNKLFIVFASGIGQSKFNSFAKTFRITD